MKFNIMSREMHEYNTDPERRCYNGCHFKSEWVWSDWATLYTVSSEEEAQESVERWRYLAKSSGRKLEYKSVEV